MTALFSPKSIALIGASSSPTKVGAIVLKNIINSGYKGQIYPVNLNAQDINGLKCYPNVASLPEKPDLAIIAIPTQPALEALVQIGETGIKNVVIYTAGFKEVGMDGAVLEKQLLSIAQKYQLNVLGPNCFGFVNNLCPLNTTFGQPSHEAGNLRFISQSGAIASSLFDWCASQNLGFSEFVTLGNKTVLNENDILRYFQQNSLPTQTLRNHSWLLPIGLYLESISNGQEFIKIATELTKTTPVFIIKPGKTKAAASAMKSHTGAIAGEDYILDAALKQAGVLRCQTLEDFFDLSRALSWENLPAGPKVAVVSNAGGPSVICADAIESEGLEMAEFDPKTRLNLLEVLPRSASIANPVDVLGDALAERFAKATEIILQTGSVDSVVVILTPQVMTQIEPTAEALGKLSEKYQKPIFCSFIGGGLVAEGERKLNEYKIPSFRFPERAITAIGAMWRFRQRQLELTDETLRSGQNVALPETITNQTKLIIQRAIGNSHQTLDNMEANEILKISGLLTPETAQVAGIVEASDFANTVEYPVVLKISSPGLLHKRKVGGVITNIRNKEQLESAWLDLKKKIASLSEGVKNKVEIQIQKQVASGVELIIGVKRDPVFGQVLLFGAGGSLAELIADRNLHLLPIDLAQAQKLVVGSRAFTLLKNYDLAPLYDCLLRLSLLAENSPQIQDIEINPVIVNKDGVWAVDGKVILNG